MKCPECGCEMYPTHDIADARIWECDKCETQIPYDSSTSTKKGDDVNESK